MDRHVLWLRRQIIKKLARSALATAMVVAALITAALLVRTDTGVLSAAVAGVVGGQVVACARMVHALYRNPLNQAYIEQFVSHPYSYVAYAADADDELPAPHDRAAELFGFSRIAVLTDENADPAPVFDVFASQDRLIVAAVSRVSGAVELATDLDDGRILSTQSLLVPPHRWLVVNTVEGASPSQLFSGHRSVLATLTELGVHPVTTGQATLIDVFTAEHDAYSELGPMLGSFLGVDQAGWNPLPLLVRPPVREVLELSLAATRPGRRARAVAAASSSENEAPVAARTSAGVTRTPTQRHVPRTPTEASDDCAAEEPVAAVADPLAGLPLPETQVGDLYDALAEVSRAAGLPEFLHELPVTPVVRMATMVPRLKAPASAAVAPNVTNAPDASGLPDVTRLADPDRSPLEHVEVPSFVPDHFATADRNLDPAARTDSSEGDRP